MKFMQFVTKSKLKGQSAIGINSPNTFNPAEFVEYFERNYARPRPVPHDKESWPVISAQEEVALKDLLAKLAFGEASEGRMGKKLATLTKDETDMASLNWYVKEEERHGQELFWLAEQLKLGLDPEHPTRGAKIAMKVNDIFNIGRVVDVAGLILSGEVVVLSLYREIGTRSSHPLVQAVMHNIVRDEAGHIRYHNDRVYAAFCNTNRFGRLILKTGHVVGLLTVLLAAALLLRSDIRILTKLSWSELLTIVESDYTKCFNHEMSYFRSLWVFKFIRLLQLK
jgi:hypothetical protein